MAAQCSSIGADGETNEMNGIKIWVDDLRPAPPHYKHFKTVDGTIRYLSSIDPRQVEIISLDHDAGDYAKYGGDYIRILDWLEFMNISIPIELHTGNIVGRKNMERIIKKNNWKMI